MEKKQFRWWHILPISIFSLMAAVTFFLLICTLINTFKSNEEILQGFWSLPTHFSFENYRKLMIDEGFFTYYKNSILIALSIMITVYVSAMASYGLTKFKYKGRGFVKLYFLIGMFFPIKLAISALYILMTNMNLTNKLTGMALLNISYVSMPIFVITGVMMSVPDSVIESAKIEGAGQFRIFNQLVFPMIKPAIGAVVPLLFTTAWNDYMLPMTMLRSREKYTVPLGIATYRAAQFFDISKMYLVFTSVVMSILPVLILYLLFSKQIISGVMTGSVKE